MAEQMGAGAALFDYDGDGDLDVYLVQSGRLAEGGGNVPTPTSRLFRNDLSVAANGTRTLRFSDVTERAGVGRPLRTGWGPRQATTTTTAISICSSRLSVPRRSIATTATEPSPT